MRGLSSILSLFRNELNKLNNTAAQMLDSMVLDDNSTYFRIDFLFMLLYAPTGGSRGEDRVPDPPPEKSQKYKVS